MSLNSVSLTGRITKDVDLRFTGNGKAVGSFSLAVDRQFKNAQGEKETDFINIVIWGKSAEALANYTKKGSLIGITGRIQTRNYEGKDGKRIYVTEVVAESFVFLESKNQGGSGNSGGRPTSSNNSTNSAPQNNHAAQDDPFMSHGQSIDIGDDDLPF